MDNNKKN